ncbi:peptidoglycan-binding protein [Pedobacter mucosus]|uniref:peptidoglycan-binding protein n=1 Tax=Pedobacter mucosus TaxID=2895286 RepID=UPI001EE4C52F|nr:peptidoglycan-binding protein [Pedobacter mucosus]UKT63259.1 peptidoglycan-binding protein [Pedobacter mucosus]
MATIRILLGIICLVGIGRSWNVGSRNLNYVSCKIGLHDHLFSNEAQDLAILKVLNLAKAEIGVRELTGKNDGERVEAYLNYVNVKKGQPWCAAFVSWVFWKAGFAKPKTAWSPGLFPSRRLAYIGKAGFVFGIYFSNLKRIAHCGFVVKINGSWLQTIEGNTNAEGSREGNGVYRKRRHVNTIRYYADWIGKDIKP